MNLNNCTFARPIAKLSDALIRDLEEHGPEGLSEHHDALLTMAAGVAPGRPEVFTSCAARDAALGDYGPYTQFVRATWNEAYAAGFEVQDIAMRSSPRRSGIRSDCTAGPRRRGEGHG